VTSIRKRNIKVDFNWTEETVLDAVESQFSDKQKGTFLRGIRDATSFDSRRTCDGLYMGAWKSVGVQLHGFEVKISRSDWKRELEDPSKAGQFEKFCHYWWVVVPDGIVKLDEMPIQWGLKIVSKTETGYSVRVAKAASINRDAQLDYVFFSSCLRQCRRTDPIANELQRKIDAAFEEGRVEGQSRNHGEWELKQIRQKVDLYLQQINDFEAASGIRINQWGHNPRQIGAAVRLVLDNEGTHKDELIRLIEVINRSKLELQKGLAEYIDPTSISNKEITQ